MEGKEDAVTYIAKHVQGKKRLLLLKRINK